MMDNVTEQADELPNNLFKKNALMLGQELSSQEQPLKITECQFQLIGTLTCYCYFYLWGKTLHYSQNNF